MGRTWVRSSLSRLCQQTLWGIWRGGLAASRQSDISASVQLRLILCVHRFQLNHKLVKNNQAVQRWVCGMLTRWWLASSDRCTNLHVSAMGCMHTTLSVHAQNEKKYPSDKAMVSARSILGSPNWGKNMFKKKSVCALEESAPEDLGKSLSISGGPKTQSDPCFTHTNMPIRISLKGGRRQGARRVASSRGWFLDRSLRKSLLLGEIKFKRKRRHVGTIPSFCFTFLQKVFSTQKIDSQKSARSLIYCGSINSRPPTPLKLQITNMWKEWVKRQKQMADEVFSSSCGSARIMIMIMIMMVMVMIQHTAKVEVLFTSS